MYNLFNVYIFRLRTWKFLLCLKYIVVRNVKDGSEYYVIQKNPVFRL